MRRKQIRCLQGTRDLMVLKTLEATGRCTAMASHGGSTKSNTLSLNQGTIYPKLSFAWNTEDG